MNLTVNREDPRVRRTHKLLIDSFSKLIKLKSYESISVTDITREADVNRATFYAHFADKKELFEEIVLKSFHSMLEHSILEQNELNEAIIRKIATSLYEYLKQLEGGCSSYNDATKLLVEHKIKVGLSDFMYQRLKNNSKTDITENILQINAAMIGNAICGAACMGHSTNIEVVLDEICYMVLPKLNSLIDY